MAVLERGDLLPEKTVNEFISKVKGKSALSALTSAEPIPFNGTKEFIFDLDKEIDIVAESGKKTPGGGTVEPRTVRPIKFEYSMRTSDEFMYGTEEYAMSILDSFTDGVAKKAAKGMDIAAFHGLNPRTALASTVVGDNHFDHEVTNIITATVNPDDDMESAIALIEANEGNVSGAAFSPAFRSSLAAMRDNDNRKIYPELAWGQQVGAINGLPVTSNATVSFKSSPVQAYVGNFEEYFRWGYAKEIPLEVIEFGNPDNDDVMGDLKGRNQVLLRAEFYIGWGILLPEYFSIIKTA